MKVFFDTSAFAKRYIKEIRSDKIDDLCQQATTLGLSITCLPEIFSAFNRLLREKKITKNNYTKIKIALFDDIADIDFIDVSNDVMNFTIRLLESNHLRAMDAIHLASALSWKAEIFVSSDAQQIIAAKKCGLEVISL